MIVPFLSSAYVDVVMIKYSTLDYNNDADPSSRKQTHSGCSCKILDGCILVTGSVRQSFIACAFLLSGAAQIIRSDFIICLIDIEIACNGTSSTLLNHPSPNCCWRHCKSRLTIRYASSTSKSAGGSLNARWPFSPMPTKATSIGCRPIFSSKRLRSSSGSFSPLMSTASFTPPTLSMNRSVRYFLKLALWVIGIPIYSSRWNILTLDQSIRLSCTSVSIVSNWLCPVARMILASPFFTIASLIHSAPNFPAACPNSLGVAYFSIFICIKYLYVLNFHLYSLYKWTHCTRFPCQ